MHNSPSWSGFSKRRKDANVSICLSNQKLSQCIAITTAVRRYLIAICRNYFLRSDSCICSSPFPGRPHRGGEPRLPRKLPCQLDCACSMITAPGYLSSACRPDRKTSRGYSPKSLYSLRHRLPVLLCSHEKSSSTNLSTFNFSSSVPRRRVASRLTREPND